MSSPMNLVDKDDPDMEIDINRIRLPFSDGRIIFYFKELVDNIRDKGLVVPLLVAQIGVNYVIVDGVSRFFAYQAAFPDKSAVPCTVIYDYDIYLVTYHREVIASEKSPKLKILDSMEVLIASGVKL